MAVRPIDGDELLGITRLLDTDAVRQSKTASWLLDQVLHDIQAMPTLTPPNEPLTLEHLRASPHGKIKDRTLQSICNRANEIACRPPEGDCEIKDYAETCEECRFCDNTPVSPPEGKEDA